MTPEAYQRVLAEIQASPHRGPGYWSAASAGSGGTTR
jgi:hypothetical protein